MPSLHFTSADKEQMVSGKQRMWMNGIVMNERTLGSLLHSAAAKTNIGAIRTFLNLVQLRNGKVSTTSVNVHSAVYVIFITAKIHHSDGCCHPVVNHPLVLPGFVGPCLQMTTGSSQLQRALAQHCDP
jgi:hypothetical protein